MIAGEEAPVGRVESGMLSDLGSIIKTLSRLRDDGVPRPPAIHQRYRRTEYEGRPFYQWWYFVLKDLEQDRYFALSLNPVDTVRNHDHRGVYAMFSMVEKGAGTRFHLYERSDLGTMTASSSGLDLSVVHGSSRFELHGDDPSDRIELSGRLSTASARWYSDGTLEGEAVDPNLELEWELKIRRIYGWYGEDDIEEQMTRDGLTMWNTYAHTAEVEGTVRVGSREYELGRSPRFRAYCDMNWGSEFLHGTPSRAFPWGWYYAGRPMGGDGDEVAIIAGTGRSEDTLLSGLSSPLGLNLAFEGKFADIELGGGRRAGAREIEFFRRVYLGDDRRDHADDGLPLVRRASDGQLRRFAVYRDQWVTYRDRFGAALMPRSQLVRISTGQLEVSLHFTCEVADCNRLLFPQENALFSDIEALGARCRVLVLLRDRPGGPWSTEQLRVIADFTTNDAGLEYGYLAPGSVSG